MTDETLIQENEVLKAIADLGVSLNKRIDDLEKSNNAQLEAIRQGIEDNAIRFDRLESQILSARSDIFALKADIKEARRELV